MVMRYKCPECGTLSERVIEEKDVHILREVDADGNVLVGRVLYEKNVQTTCTACNHTHVGISLQDILVDVKEDCVLPLGRYWLLNLLEE